MKVGARLETIAQFVPVGKSIVDVGTDHAYVPALLAKQGLITFAIASDIVSGPCEAAQATVDTYGLQNLIKVRQGSGLTIVVPNEVDVIVIAGMGGVTMIKILAESLPVAKSATRLVLQPMNGAAPLRAWCINQGWKIVDETLVEEASKLYVIIVLELGEQAPLEATVAEVGPLLLANKHHLLGKHIQKLIRHYNKLLNSMLHSEAARESAKYQEFALRKQELEAIARDYDCC